MKVSHDSFLQLASKPLSLKSGLFYGGSEFWTQWKIDYLLNNNPALQKTIRKVIPQDVVLSDPNLAQTLVFTADFFSGPQTLIITHATDKICSLIENLTEGPTFPFLLVKAQDYLKPTSKLRKLYEENPNLGSIPCYELTTRELDKEIASFFAHHNKKISPSLAQALSEFFHPFPDLLKGELGKILLFVGSKEEIDAQDVKKNLNAAFPSDTDDLTNAFLNRNAKDFLIQLKNLEESQYILILRSLNSALCKIHQLKGEILKGEPFEKAIHKLSPPLLFTEHPLFRKRLSVWDVSLIEATLNQLAHIEVLIKYNSRLSKEVFEFSLLECLLSPAASSTIRI